MAVPSDEHERTFAFAEIALQQMRALRLPASPRNFEVWYHYATGLRPELNRAINDRLAQNGTLPESAIERIHAAHVAPERATDRLDSVASRMADQITRLLATINAATGSATTYSASLADASEKLQCSGEALRDDGSAFRTLVGRLIAGAKEMETSNRALEARLSASREEVAQLRETLAMAQTESLIDPLTTLANRKFFDGEIERAIADAKAERHPLALLMCDVDHFKTFNDRFGHLTGDQVLRLVAVSLKQIVKGQNIVARYGGEEFVIALPNTVLPTAISIADQMRRAVMTKELMKRSSGERLGHVTVSIGVASLRPTDSPQSLIDRADVCLYAAKRSGRNQVVAECDIKAKDGETQIVPARVSQPPMIADCRANG